MRQEEPPEDPGRVRRGTHWLRAAMEPVWRHRWAGVGIAAVVAAGWGLCAAAWMPRGPVDTSDSIWSIVISVAVGLIAGLAMRSRWAMLAAPAVFVVVFELARLGVRGPTVDGIHLSTYGLIALTVGRGFQALVSWLPILWAAAIGAGLARAVRPGQPPAGNRGRWPRTARRVVAGIAGAGLVAFVVVLARPARTDPIRGSDGEVAAGSIAELVRVDVDGRDLALMIRGAGTELPVLLFLAGGPGGSELGAMRNHLPTLEDHFVVATLDQRGTGKSYGELDAAETLTVAGAVDDVVAVTNHLRERFDQDRIYLVGQSWGSILGVLAARQHPELYRAFIGVGQMVSPKATDQVFYEDTLAWARRRGDDALAGRLSKIGPPPYGDMLDYETALSYEHEVYPYDHGRNSEGAGGFSENLLVEEYSLTEAVHLLGAFMDTFATLYPQIQDVDFRTDARRMDVPVFFVQGAHEAPGRAEPFAEWYAALDAPTKDLVTLDTSGHRPMFEQPGEFVRFMTESVLTRTQPPATTDEAP